MRMSTDTLCIAFRGTYSWQDVKADFKFFKLDNDLNKNYNYLSK